MEIKGEMWLAPREIKDNGIRRIGDIIRK